MSYLKVINLTKEYKMGDQTVQALKKVNFEIEEGKLTVILGASGSGKSTTLNLLGGMDTVTSGQILVRDQDISTYNRKKLTIYRRNEIGFVFQFYNLIPNLNAFENVDITRKLSHSPLSAEQALQSVGLLHRANNFPSQLSGGELQRVSIARALCSNPNLLLCDEPTGALDSETGKKVLGLLQEMAEKFHKAVVVVTHNSAIANMANQVIYLKDGMIAKIEHNQHPLNIEEVQW